MNEIIIATIITVSTVGLLAAVILYWASQKFKVFEDPRIGKVEAGLPAANCGGCGFPGCRNFAEACVKSDDLNSLFCPVGGNETMAEVAKILGREVEQKEKQVAVVRCNGAPQFRNKHNEYDGAMNCTIASNLYSGETNCQYGCLGYGECVDACDFDAMYMDPETNLPVILEDKCTSCGGCVEACPKDIIELRPVGKKSKRIFVSCINQDKGGTAKKACSVACIGCSLCLKQCNYEAITINNFLSYIDPNKCVLCRKCVAVCPTDAIWEVNLPARKVITGDKKSKTAEVKKTAKESETKENKPDKA